MPSDISLLVERLGPIMAEHTKVRFVTVDGRNPTHCLAYHAETECWSSFDLRNGVEFLHSSYYLMICYDSILGKREYERNEE
jgi:hypothetical protein